MADVKGFTFFASYHKAFKELTQKERGVIMVAMSDYVFEDITPNFKTSALRMAWQLVEPNLTTSKIRSNVGKLGIGKSKMKANQKQNESKPKAMTSLDKDKDKDKELLEPKGSMSNNKKNNNKLLQKKVFVAPSIKDVEEYIKSKNYHFDAKAFFDYYEAEDWHYFSGGKKVKVKSWKQCCATWESQWARKHPEENKKDGVQFPTNPRHGDRLGYDWFYDVNEGRWIKDREVNSKGETFLVADGRWHK